jgi:hypothetical protein
MSMKGDWGLQYCWAPQTNYASANITFNDDRTFTSGNSKGQWRLLDGTLMLSFNDGPAKYGGNLDGNAATGAMSTFAGLNGCWMLEKHASTVRSTAAGTSAFDPSGNRL